MNTPVSAKPPFELPPYPHDRLDRLRGIASAHQGGYVDLSIGTPGDPPPEEVAAAHSRSKRLASYPPPVGVDELRQAAALWLARRFEANVPSEQVGLCVGAKEFVASLPRWLRLQRPERDTVLYPAVSYPSYAMGAQLAGCRAIPVRLDDKWHLDLDSISGDDLARALCLWVNTPGNPTGALEDLGRISSWGLEHDVPVFSDECYIEYTWDALDGKGPVAPADGLVPGRTILNGDLEGVVAVHSLSKRSNLAGARVGFYAGDPELVGFLSEVRKHAGLMVPGPSQDAAVAALCDDAHVDEQRTRYWDRLARLQTVLGHLGVEAPMPQGGFYLWTRAPQDDAWGFAEVLAESLGVVVSPGEFYGAAGAGYVRLAAVLNDVQLELVESRVDATA